MEDWGCEGGGGLVKGKDTEWNLSTCYLLLLFPIEFSESGTLLSGRFWPIIPIPGLMDGIAFVA